MASIARKNLLEDIPRFLVAQAGILFAVSLVTIQTGLQSGFTKSSSLLIDKSQADIWVTSKNMEHMGLTLSMPYSRVAAAENVAGVERAEAVIIRATVWRKRTVDQIASATLIGANPNGLLFPRDNLTQGSFSDLAQPYSVIVNQTSQSSLDLPEIDSQGRISSLPARLVGLTQGTQAIVFDNLIFTSLVSAKAYSNAPATTETVTETTPPTPQAMTATDPISFVLVRAEPGTDLNQLKQRLEATLPNTRAFTRDEMAYRTQVYWQERSGIGFVLGLGAVVGIVVGIVIVGQILYASVSDHLKEFGTLKAMGASNWFIYSLIMEQALWMAVLGYLPGMALCLGVAQWTAATQGLMILITPASATTVLAITVVMCVSSAVFAIQKVTRVDPAIVFKS